MTYWDEIDKKKYCAWCGKATPKSIENIELPHGEPYTGNAQVISRKQIFYRKTHDNLRITHNLFRDFKYGNFDKLRCAEAFANAAYRIGIRKLRREE
ncbi:hypothetical protein [uncultured Mediterranean phage uvDeep-CGR0-AD1-C123]|nr:hypothetical protein [uncultured Mediterranean phage uvDeep-CGR0-AD1-C123]